MSIPTYVEGFPQDGQSLGASKAQIRDNLDGTFETLGTDHVNNNGEAQSAPLSGNPPGYHTIIHEVTQTSVNTIAGVNQIFSGIPGTLVVNTKTTPAIPNNNDTQLYTLTGAAVGLAGLSQMTGNNALANGYVWCAGILLMWGNSSSNSVSFSPNFPNNCLNVEAVYAKATTSFDMPIGVISQTAAGFSISSSGGPFNWFAIGN